MIAHGLVLTTAFVLLIVRVVITPVVGGERP